MDERVGMDGGVVEPQGCPQRRLSGGYAVSLLGNLLLVGLLLSCLGRPAAVVVPPSPPDLGPSVPSEMGSPGAVTLGTTGAPLEPSQLHVYRARCDRAVDGDTQDLAIDVGFRLTTSQRIRLLDADAPERRGATKPAGDAALAYASQWLGCGQGGMPLLVHTAKQDSFGRWLADVTRDRRDFATELIAAGHAAPFVPNQRTLFSENAGLGLDSSMVGVYHVP